MKPPPSSCNPAADAAVLLRRSRLPAHPYLRGLADGRFDRASVARSQAAFYHAVEFYPRPMALLLSRIAAPAQRLGLLRNLVEEHGEFDERGFHVQSFRRFLATLGGAQPAARAHPAVVAFNYALVGACGHAPVPVGACALGVIELAFADISAAIGRAVVARGWVPRRRLEHYSLHAELDRRHAADLFATVAPMIGRGSGRADARQGLRLGLQLFERLYDALAAIATGKDRRPDPPTMPSECPL